MSIVVLAAALATAAPATTASRAAQEPAGIALPSFGGPRPAEPFPVPPRVVSGGDPSEPFPVPPKAAHGNDPAEPFPVPPRRA